MKKKPIFDKKTGYLIPGTYLMTIAELLNHKILASTPERKTLIHALELACKTYWQYGITEIYANGSFATAKPVPADIDGYLLVSYTDSNFLKLTDSGSIWGDFRGKSHPNDKVPMWYEHKIEFYVEDPKYPNSSDFNPTNFFTHSREGIERGIIKIIQ